MVAKLVVAKGKTAVKEIPLSATETLIGRRNDCTLRIPSPLVSRQHCTLNLKGERLLVKDLGSSNGTFVNGARVKQKELRSGDTLGVGPVTFIVQLGAEAGSPGDTARPAPSAAAGDDASDFVVEAETEEAADFVVEEQPASEDAGDFVVEEQPTATEPANDVVVAEEVAGSDDDMGFVVADEATAADTGDADFVVAEPVADSETMHDVSLAEIEEGDAPTSVREPDTQVLDDSESGAAVKAATAKTSAKSEEPKKKAGLFGRLFKKKEKPAKQSSDEADVAKPAPPPPRPAKGAAKKPTAATPPRAAAPKPAADDDGFTTQEDCEKPSGAKPVDENDLADFLMGLNEKDQ